MRADAGVRLDATLPLPNTEVVVAADGEPTRRSTRSTTTPTSSTPSRTLPVAPALERPALRQPVGPEQHRADGLDAPGRRTPTSTRPRPGRRRAARGRRSRSSTPGVEPTHPDLAGQWTGNPGERGGGKETNGVDDDHNGFVDDWQGWDFVNNDNTQESQGNFHGTHVAGHDRGADRQRRSASPASRRRPRCCR